MSRQSHIPVVYSTFAELERGFLTQVRRFHRASQQIRETSAARPIMLSAPGMDVPSSGTPRSTEENADHQRLELMRSQVILLQNMSAQIITNFPGDPRADRVRREVDALADECREKSEALRQQLAQVARKQVDRTVVVRNHMLRTTLERILAKRVSQIDEMYLIGPVALPGMRGETVMADVAYLRLEDLKGPDGFVHPSYFLVTAHPREAGNGRLAQMYVGSGPDYRVPSRVRWTASARTPQELIRVCEDTLLGEGVIGANAERTIPVPSNSVKFVHDNVKKTTVQGNAIVVAVKDKSRIEETREALRRQLTGIVRQTDPRNRDVIRDRVDARKGTITLAFSLPGRLRGRIVDPDTMRRIGTMLDLDAATLQRVRTAIENPE